MMPMFLTVYLSSSEHHVAEVPVTPETLCRDVLELCREPGENQCYLAELWRDTERVVLDCERMQDVLQRWGQQREELRYILRHQSPPVGPSADDQRFSKTAFSENQVPRSLADLQDMATRQQEQIHVTQQLLVSKEQRLHSLRQQEVQRSEQEHLLQLRANAQTQEAKLKTVRAVRTRVEQKRLSNSKLVEEVEQMSGLFQQKQRELLVAVARVEELNQQLQTLRSRAEPAPSSPAHSSQLDLLYKELQLRSRLNQEQGSRLQQHRDALARRNVEVSSMERRVGQLRQRLWKKKAALHATENTPVLDSQPPQPCGPSRVAAVGPYIQSCGPQGPPVPQRQEVLVKTSYPDGTSPDPALIPPPRPAKPSSGFQATKSSLPSHSSTLPRMSAYHRHHTDEHLGSEVPPPVPSRTTTDPQVKTAAPPVPSKPRLFTSTQTSYSTGTFPGKTQSLASNCHTLPLPHKQDKTPAAAVRPFTPDPPLATPPAHQKPQTLATSSIYSMYTAHAAHAKTGHGTLPRSQARVYGKPLLPASGGQQSDNTAVHSGSSLSDGDDPELLGGASPAEGPDLSERSAPRPLSPTKLLPFLSQHTHRNPSDADLDALRRRLRLAPRPLKKRSSITEPEGPAGPNIQKLLYQKTTLAAMETVEPVTAVPASRDALRPVGAESEERATQALLLYLPAPPYLTPPPPLTPSLPPLEEEGVGGEGRGQASLPPYPPPPYSCRSQQEEEPEISAEVTLPPGKRSNLRQAGSDRIQHGMRVRFSPLALLLDSSLEGEYHLVQRVIYDVCLQVEDPSTPNDEGITALHNAVCAGHSEIVKFLVHFGVNVNAADSDGWTPLHCAASCNNVQVCKFLVESGAAVFATTSSDLQTAADKCEELEDGYAQCSQFLYGVQEKMGVMNHGQVYALWDYDSQQDEELSVQEGEGLVVLRREEEWWWVRCGGGREGYVARNLLGLYVRIKPRQRTLA
ncbi:Apoptosis-stimulating of p53 protein 1 [Merluccius polli]|uniref:Apoptosis-stimulating of p53 protein 1 n=1 Tax=Merluccius polli TaxID=89951 RepID=A0AA47M5U8_MERPO|nr:Apoptosis-stimulating of p53 protein 1 [Merluccius polli]